MQYGYGGGYGGAYGPRMSTMPMQGMPGLQPIPPVGGGFWGAQNLSYPYELPRHDYTPQEWWEPTDYVSGGGKATRVKLMKRHALDTQE